MSLEQLTKGSIETMTVVNAIATAVDAATAQDTYKAAVETVTVGACSITKQNTNLSITGTKAYTLADGTTEGQLKDFLCTVAASTPAGTLTPAHAVGFTSAAFNAVGDTLRLRWSVAAAAWAVVSLNSVTLS